MKIFTGAALRIHRWFGAVATFGRRLVRSGRNEMSRPSDSKQLFTLKSKDGREFEVSSKVTCQSIMLNEMIAITAPDGIIPVGIDGDVLSKIVSFCQHFENEPTYVPFKTNKSQSTPIATLSPWEKTFFEMSNEEFNGVINGASYLNIPRLTDACSLRLAAMVHGRSSPEMRKIFKINEPGFTAEEKRTIERDHVWFDCPVNARAKPKCHLIPDPE